MRQTYIWDEKADKLVPKEDYLRRKFAGKAKTFHYWPDLKEYASPIDGRPISGRADRRWDMERSGSCEPMNSPSNVKGVRSEKYAKLGLPLIGRDCDEWSKKRQ